MVAFLRLTRWPNLVIIALVQYLMRFSLIEYLEIPHVLNHFEFFLGVLCSISLAAGGYIINDLNDLEADAINKPARISIGKGISENTAWSLYLIFTAIALGCGYWLGQVVALPNLGYIPVLAALLLYLYALDLKKRAVIGNLLVALLTGLPVFLVGVFDVLPAAELGNAAQVKSAFEVITAYSLFAFWINLMRELAKDAQDTKGDAAQGYRTLAVLLGPKNQRLIIFALALVLFIFTAYFNWGLYPGDPLSTAYVALFVNAPLLFFIVKSTRARRSDDFRRLSNLLKIIMLTGILSMVIFSVSIELQRL